VSGRAAEKENAMGTAEISWCGFGFYAGVVVREIRQNSCLCNYKFDDDVYDRLLHVPHKIAEDVVNSYKYHFRRKMLNGTSTVCKITTEEIEHTDKYQAVLLDMIAAIKLDECYKLTRNAVTQEQSEQFSKGWWAARKMLYLPTKTVE